MARESNGGLQENGEKLRQGEIDYTIIKDKRIRTKICQLMSAMLDNPDKYGIYPTSEFMSKMEDFVLEIRHEAMGWTWAEACRQLDKDKDPRDCEQGDLIARAKEDLSKP